MGNADGSTNSAYGLQTNYQKFDPKWIRKLIQIYTTVDPGVVPTEDLNAIFNQFGIQPVVFVTLKNQAIRAYNPGFARAISGGTAIEQNADSTFVQSPVSANTGSTGQNNGTTVYTVTTGRTFYCTGLLLSNGGNATGQMLLQTAAGATTLWCDVMLQNTARWYSSGQTPLFSVPSAGVITVTGGGAGGNECVLVGWEE